MPPMPPRETSGATMPARKNVKTFFTNSRALLTNWHTESSSTEMVRHEDRAVHAEEVSDQVPPAFVGRSGRKYGGRSSLLQLTVDQEPRRWAIATRESRFFEPFILVCILANCVTLAWQSPLDPCCTPKAIFIQVCDTSFLIIFTVEMFLKMLAFGLYAHNGCVAGGSNSDPLRPVIRLLTADVRPSPLWQRVPQGSMVPARLCDRRGRLAVFLSVAR